MSILKTIWAGPGVLFGDFLALLFGDQRLTVDGARARARWYVAGGAMAWYFRRFRFRALSSGRCVFVREAELAELETLVRHELEHVDQQARWGPLFVVLYTWSWLWRFVRELGRGESFMSAWKRAYRDIPFEVAARAAEKGPNP